MNMPSMGRYYEWPDQDHHSRCPAYEDSGADCVCPQIEEDDYEAAQESEYEEKHHAQMQ